jgi:hypothetical protein
MLGSEDMLVGWGLELEVCFKVSSRNSRWRLKIRMKFQVNHECPSLSNYTDSQGVKACSNADFHPVIAKTIVKISEQGPMTSRIIS